MSDPSLSPLVRRAARNLHTVEWLSGNGTWRFDWFCRWYFWSTRRMMAMTPDEATAWLPTLAFAVSCEKDDDILFELVRWPLPEPLPPEALPWRDRLIQVWEQYRPATAWEKTMRLAALVRLDRRTERLPEWLQEARQAMDIKPENRRLRLVALAALAGWRPRPGDGPPHGGKAEAAQAWVRFWKERYRTPGSELDGLIAAAALLHLAEAGWLPSGPSPERLREEFHQWMQQWSVSTYQDLQVLRILLSSVPADASAPEQQQQNIMKWLELTRRNVPREKREAAWGMLAAWQREGILERSSRGRLPEPPRLLPDLARTLEWEQDREVLQAMVGYVPGAAEVRAHPKAVRNIVARWEALGRNDDWLIRQAAWVGRWNLMRAGVLTAEEQERFGADYVKAMKFEPEVTALLTLAQITPPGMFPLATWAGRLSDQDNACRLVAGLAIHGWLVDMAGGGQRIASGSEASGGQRVAGGKEANGEWRIVQNPLFAIPYSLFPTHHSPLATGRRQVRQVLRRAGQDTDAGTVVPFVNLPPDVLPDFRRLHEIETALAAGQMPPPDAAAKNRATPRVVPARLPEAHPRTDPPSITDRTTGRIAGSDPQTRHPFPEVIRHE